MVCARSIVPIHRQSPTRIARAAVPRRPFAPASPHRVHARAPPRASAPTRHHPITHLPRLTPLRLSARHRSIRTFPAAHAVPSSIVVTVSAFVVPIALYVVAALAPDASADAASAPTIIFFIVSSIVCAVRASSSVARASRRRRHRATVGVDPREPSRARVTRTWDKSRRCTVTFRRPSASERLRAKGRSVEHTATWAKKRSSIVAAGRDASSGRARAGRRRRDARSTRRHSSTRDARRATHSRRNA